MECPAECKQALERQCPPQPMLLARGVGQSMTALHASPRLHSSSPLRRSSVATYFHGRPLGALIPAAVPRPPQQRPPVAVPWGAWRIQGGGPPLPLPSALLVRNGTTPWSSARGANVRVRSAAASTPPPSRLSAATYPRGHPPMVTFKTAVPRPLQQPPPRPFALPLPSPPQSWFVATNPRDYPRGAVSL